MRCQPSSSLAGLRLWVTGACTRPSAGWNRSSVVGRSAKISARSPCASREMSSVTMNVSEKRGYTLRT